jgi:hypothetical protein
LAGAAFKDPEVVKLASKFVPVLVDGDVDKEFGKEYGVSGFPNTVFADPKAKKVSFVTGAVDTKAFLEEMKSALKKIGPVAPRKAVKDLEDAAAALAKAREKGDWRATIKAAAAIEKINHEGPALDAARKAKTDASEEGKKRIEAARALLAEGKAPEARAAAVKVATEFEGTDEAAAAKALVKEIDAAAQPPAPPK